MPGKRNLTLVFLLGIIGLAVGECGIAQEPKTKTVLATVNGVSITEGDLTFLLRSRRVPDEQRNAVKERFLEILIERQLMREFLASRKAQPSQTELDSQMARVLKVITDSGDDPDKILAQMGMTRETLKKELALPLTWKSHLRLVVSNPRLREYYENRRVQFDGTKVRASQIFLKLPKTADANTVKQAEEKLRQLKIEIAAKKIAFTEAAKAHSEAPSKTEGGDTGWISYRGSLPSAVSDAAFALETGELSEPIRSPFGVHLVTILDRKPGELSLEDVRATVFNQLSKELWQETVQAQRAKARINKSP